MQSTNRVPRQIFTWALRQETWLHRRLQRAALRAAQSIQSIIDALFATVDGSTESAERLEFVTERATYLFAQALHENSNLEMDWLWYAANMCSVAERRYCLHRALTINSHSGLARSAL